MTYNVETYDENVDINNVTMKHNTFSHTWRTTIILSIPSLLLALFLVPKTSFADPYTDENMYLAKIAEWFVAWNTADNKKEVLQAFCTAMSSDEVQAWFVDSAAKNIYYSSKHSLFVQALCGWLWEKNTFWKISLIKGKTRDQILWKPVKGCTWDEFMSCDFSILLPALFNAVMNDHSTLAVAWFAMWDNVDKQIQEFSVTYFGDVKSICKEDNQYISQKSSASDVNALCSHPITYQSLKNTFELLHKQKKDLRIIEGNGFGNNTRPSDCTNSTRIYDMLFECAYSNATKQDATKYQYNLRYNELLYYKVLLWWLINEKLQDPNISQITVVNGQSIKEDISTETQNLKREQIISEQAVQIMQKSINNIRATFPLHIWLQAYYEDLVTFRKSLVKVYTPIHQLNYKLRNIQEKK